ncbi:hypothetical protein [Nocardia heshunensis]
MDDTVARRDDPVIRAVRWPNGKRTRHRRGLDHARPQSPAWAQDRGEIPAGLDPAFVRMALMGMILAPVMLPETALQATGKQPGTPEFEEYYGAQLRALIQLLGR